MSKVNIIVLAFVSLMLADTLALGQVRKPAAGARENAATSGPRTIEPPQTAQASHDPSQIAYLRG